MSYLKLKCTKFNFGWGSAFRPRPSWGNLHVQRSPDLLGERKGLREEEGNGERDGKERGRAGVEGSTQLGLIFSLVYATPLLQHQAQLGLNPALGCVALGR